MDEEAGFEMLKRMTGLRPIWAKDTDTMMNSMRTGDAMIGILYKSQTYTVKGWGAPVEWVYPKEGGIPYTSGTCIAKGTKNLEAAEEYINATMDPGCRPSPPRSTTTAVPTRTPFPHLSPELQERVRFPQDQLDRLIKLDSAWMTDRRAAWVERWNRWCWRLMLAGAAASRLSPRVASQRRQP